MCSRVGASGVSVSGRGAGSGDRGRDSSDGEPGSMAGAPCLEASLQVEREGGTAGEGSTTGLEDLPRPTLPGRKSLRKARGVHCREGDSIREGTWHHERGPGDTDQERDRRSDKHRERAEDRQGLRSRTHSRSSSSLPSPRGSDRHQTALVSPGGAPNLPVEPLQRFTTHLPASSSSHLALQRAPIRPRNSPLSSLRSPRTGAMEVHSRAPLVLRGLAPVAERRTLARERNKRRSLRRKQRRRERWRQSQEQGNIQSSTVNPSSSSEDEDVSTGDREGFVCAVCLDVYFSPYMCHPCSHIFCEPCLRTLAKNSPTNTPCPLCRTIITHVFFQKELNQTTRTFFPKEYLSRKQHFQKASCAKWPLPSCRKLFRIFGGFQRPASPIARRQFPHGAYRLDAMDFEDDSRGWRFDMDMVIIYIYSVNWIIGFFIFCFLCYVFFPSF
ncbi:uncharacterized protein rnf180a [Aplochiton taeniatus]